MKSIKLLLEESFDYNTGQVYTGLPISIESGNNVVSAVVTIPCEVAVTVKYNFHFSGYLEIIFYVDEQSKNKVDSQSGDKVNPTMSQQSEDNVHPPIEKAVAVLSNILYYAVEAIKKVNRSRQLPHKHQIHTLVFTSVVNIESDGALAYLSLLDCQRSKTDKEFIGRNITHRSMKQKGNKVYVELNQPLDTGRNRFLDMNWIKGGLS